MTGASEFIYDQLPYPRLSYLHTAPDRLATIATLLSVEGPPVQNCRVLEVGAALGGNLIPMAVRMPGSTFLGIDLSARQTAEAQATVEGLGLTNISFEQRDITHFDDDLEPFDYIIAHGLYSWMPTEARQGLLDTCAQRLTPHGVAMISYNTYPGWYALQLIRFLMQQASAGLTDPAARARAALQAVQAFSEICPDNHPYSVFTAWYLTLEKSRLELGDGVAPTLLLHDELAEINEPCYVTDFVAAAGRAGLTYLSDADLPVSFPNSMPDDVIAAISKRVKSAVEFEQQLDIVRNNTFRRSLLVRSPATVQHRLRPDLFLLRRFFVRSRALPEEPVTVGDASVAAYDTPSGLRFTTDHPLTKAAMVVLGEVSPRALSFEELATRAWAAADGAGTKLPPEEQMVLLGANLLRAFTYNTDLLEFRLTRPVLPDRVSERPATDPYSILLAGEGDLVVTNQYHERLKLHPAQAFVLSLLDGTRTREELAAAVEGLVEDHGPQADAPDATELIDECLEFFASAALLLR